MQYSCYNSHGGCSRAIMIMLYYDTITLIVQIPCTQNPKLPRSESRCEGMKVKASEGAVTEVRINRKEGVIDENGILVSSSGCVRETEDQGDDVVDVDISRKWSLKERVNAEHWFRGPERGPRRRI